MTVRRALIELLSHEARSVSSIARELGLRRAEAEDDLRHALQALRIRVWRRSADQTWPMPVLQGIAGVRAANPSLPEMKNTYRFAAIAAALGLAIARLSSQTPERKPSFDVISIKPSPPLGNGGPIRFGGGAQGDRFTINSATLRTLLQM